MNEKPCFVVFAKADNGMFAICATFASLEKAKQMKAVYDNIISNRGFLIVNGIRSFKQLFIEETTFFGA